MRCERGRVVDAGIDETGGRHDGQELWVLGLGAGGGHGAEIALDGLGRS